MLPLSAVGIPRLQAWEDVNNSVLLLMDLLSRSQSLTLEERIRLTRSAWLLFGFLFGCLVAAGAVSLFADWAWTLPVMLAAAALLFLR